MTENNLNDTAAQPNEEITGAVTENEVATEPEIPAEDNNASAATEPEVPSESETEAPVEPEISTDNETAGPAEPPVDEDPVPVPTETYGVYILVGTNNEIISVNSDAFLTDEGTGWVKIDEGSGDKYHHAQNNYFEKSLWCDGGPARYKYVDGEVAEKTQEEIEAEIASYPEPEQSNEDLLMETAADHEYRLCLIELGLTEEDLEVM